MKKTSLRSVEELLNRIRRLETPVVFYITLEPFSAMIINQLVKLQTLRERNKLFEEIFNHPDMEIIPDTGGLVRVYKNHKTNNKTWSQTLQMARYMATRGIPVAFLPEQENETSADAVTKIKGKWRLVDFKYCVTTKTNTIQTELKTAFKQAQGVVIQLKNADGGQFKEAIEYFRRNYPKRIRDVIIINEYGKILELERRQLWSGLYTKKVKGFF